MKNRIFYTLIIIFLFISVSYAEQINTSTNLYPNIYINGYKSWMFRKITVEPASNYFNYNSTQEASRFGSSDWAETLNLSINGELSPDLSVYYKVCQVPALNERFDIDVKYLNHYHFYFGKLNQSLISNQEYLSPGFASGMGFLLNWDKWKLKIIPSATYSNSSSTTIYNTWINFRSPEYYGNRMPTIPDDNPEQELYAFDLKRLDIMEENAELYLNKNKLLCNKDFYIKDKLLLFPKTLLCTEEIKVKYTLINGQAEEISFNPKTQAKRRAFLIQLLSHSEQVIVDNVVQQRNIDYKIDYNLGMIVFKYPLPEDAKVRIDYSYYDSAFSQDLVGGAIEYQLYDWNNLGIYYSEISTSSKSPVRNPWSYGIIGLYNKMYLREDTIINAELASSNTTSSSTSESDSAVKINGQTRLGNLDLEANYETNGLNFASERRVRLNTKSKYNEAEINADYKLSDSLSIRGGVGSIISQEGTTSCESSVSLASVGLDWEFAPNRLYKIMYKVEKGNYEKTTSQFCYRNNNFYLFPILKTITNKSSLFAKLYKIDAKTNSLYNICRGEEIGWQLDFTNNILIFTSYNHDSYSQYNQTTFPYIRASYKWEWLEIFGDYSIAVQNGTNISNDTKETGGGIIIDIAQDNPIISKFKIGCEGKRASYTDHNNSANYYDANEMRFNGRLEF